MKKKSSVVLHIVMTAICAVLYMAATLYAGAFAKVSGAMHIGFIVQRSDPRLHKLQQSLQGVDLGVTLTNRVQYAPILYHLQDLYKNDARYSASTPEEQAELARQARFAAQAARADFEAYRLHSLSQSNQLAEASTDRLKDGAELRDVMPAVNLIAANATALKLVKEDFPGYVSQEWGQTIASVINHVRDLKMLANTKKEVRAFASKDKKTGPDLITHLSGLISADTTRPEGEARKDLPVLQKSSSKPNTEESLMQIIDRSGINIGSYKDAAHQPSMMPGLDREPETPWIQSVRDMVKNLLARVKKKAKPQPATVAKPALIRAPMPEVRHPNGLYVYVVMSDYRTINIYDAASETFVKSIETSGKIKSISFKGNNLSIDQKQL